ncbi:hypothetical protein BESB_060350 [Besnoitia besnoiti]|uniref:BOS complex subunit TMEM147 n=1 Tax=Besnoitia besnoiti TaxID=94643 RepID=A0A2A9M9J3_BESBE|nr:hypothetical protein BESB_060350 [Besnoitia besnoiti]PFH35148.1 hypothetical protein BESB_060350 [Besnoitia besnoiti]
MTILHFAACSVCCFGPNYAIYKGTEVSEQAGTMSLIAFSSVAYLLTQLLKSLIVASLVPATCHSYFVCEALTQVLLGALELMGLYFVVRHRTALAFDADSRLLSVGLGWSFAHSLFTNLLPVIASARTAAFHWKFFYGALSANVSTVSLMALTVLVFLATRRKQAQATATTASALAAVLLLFPFVSSRLVLGNTPATGPAGSPAWWALLVLQAAVAAAVAFAALQMYRPRANKSSSGPTAGAPMSSQSQGSGSSIKQE